jgi:RNA polymerase-binding transcription factor DksA
MPNPHQVSGDGDAFVNEQNDIAAEIAKAQQSLAVHSGFTLCTECGDYIGDERKKALPSAVHCIGCATALEVIKQSTDLRYNKTKGQ